MASAPRERNPPMEELLAALAVPVPGHPAYDKARALAVVSSRLALDANTPTGHREAAKAHRNAARLGRKAGHAAVAYPAGGARDTDHDELAARHDIAALDAARKDY